MPWWCLVPGSWLPTQQMWVTLVLWVCRALGPAVTRSWLESAPVAAGCHLPSASAHPVPQLLPPQECQCSCVPQLCPPGDQSVLEK